MAVGACVAFWGVSLLLVLTPGADWAYMIGAGLRGRSVLPAAIGLLVGYLVLTAVVAGGVAALVAKSSMLLSVLTSAGVGVPDLAGCEQPGPTRRPGIDG